MTTYKYLICFEIKQIAWIKKNNLFVTEKDIHTFQPIYTIRDYHQTHKSYQALFSYYQLFESGVYWYFTTVWHFNIWIQNLYLIIYWNSKFNEYVWHKFFLSILETHCPCISEWGAEVGRLWACKGFWHSS